MPVEAWLLLVSGLVILVAAVLNRTLRLGPFSLPALQPLGRGLIIAVGVGLLAFGGFTALDQDGGTVDVSPAGPPDPTASPPAAPRPAARAEITAPGDGTPILGRTGTVLTGTATLNAGDSLWLFDHDPSTRRFWFVNSEPITVAAGRWSFQDMPIGGVADPNGTKYPVLLVLADARCTAALRAAGPSGGGAEVLPRLPAGCTQADEVTLVKAG